MTAAAVTEVDGGAVIDADRVRGRLRGFLVGGCGAGGLSVGRVSPAGQAFDVSAVLASSDWTWNRPVPRQRALCRPCSFLSSATAPSASASLRMYAHTPRTVLRRCLAAWAACWASVSGNAAGGQHRALRRHERGDPQLRDTVLDVLGGEALVSPDGHELRAREPRPLQNRHEHIALVAVVTGDPRIIFSPARVGPRSGHKDSMRSSSQTAAP